VVTVKQKLGYDDSLDAFGVHGCGGTLGALLTGVFATSAVNQGFNGPLGLVDGHPGQIWNQAIGCAVAWVLAIVGTLIVLKICDALIGLRVTASQETEGLDVSLHGEEGYILEA
jgi:Amt family ammonium transporter